jgi:nucleotide-binding universal stress UspA family protein
VSAVVWPVSSGASNTVEGLVAQAHEERERTLRQSGVHSDDEVVEVGDPLENIDRVAREHGAVLVVVGASDKGWWRRLLEGSVTEDLVRHARLPVQVVR